MRPNRARVALVISSAAESLVRSVWMGEQFDRLGVGSALRLGALARAVALDRHPINITTATRQISADIEP
jgi:hypothetical protein